MPIAHIAILEGRPREKRLELIHRVTDAIADSLEVPAERVRVLIHEVPPEDWGIGGATVAESRGGGTSSP